jgi:3-hydroxyisobutyrate dehydrogenase-like beta-hydroxyacid dehydrogenase
MGTPMAVNLVRSGFRLRVWNRTAERTTPLVRLGAIACESAAECARNAQVVITMLSDADALASVLGGDHGILAGLTRRAIVLDMSTVGRAAARRAAHAVEGAGGRFVDAPVSGTVKPAEKGELVALVGGRLKDVAKVEPVLAPMCKRTLYAGEVGQGQALKVVLNGLGAHHLVAFTSMLVLGERAGLRRETIVEAFTSGAFASPSYVGKKAKVLARDYSPEFSLALTLKNCAANVELQRDVGLTLPVHRECMREIEDGVREGLGDEDLFALEKHFAAR